MKNLFLTYFIIFAFPVFSQAPSTLPIKTDVKEVVVFFENAQITRQKSVALQNGNQTLTFTGLSPYIDAKSIQLKAKGNFTILSVNYQHNFVEQEKKDEKTEALEGKINLLGEGITREKTYLSIIAEEIAFMNANKEIGGMQTGLSLNALKEIAQFYRDKLTELKLDQNQREKKLGDLKREKKLYELEIKALSDDKVLPQGEIVVQLESRANTIADFELSYLVSSAGWFPSYDLKVKNVEEPAQLVYKANVYQNTQVDWKDVKITLSSANPNKSGVAPVLKTYYLDYYSRPPIYTTVDLNSISGQIFDAESNEPLPGINVLIKGTTIGTVTDINGQYSLTLPNDATTVVFSAVGYTTQEMPISSAVINVGLTPDIQSLQEVVVTGYGTKRGKVSKLLQGNASGINISATDLEMEASKPVQSETINNQTTFEFDIKNAYSISSTGKKLTIDVEKHALPAYYEYYAVPKIDRDAFLLAHITNWEQYNLLEGEANIFFEDTYIGKTIIDVRHASDTLQISLGRDKSVSIARNKIKDYTDKQFLGTKKTESIGWEIVAKNQKSQPININIFDQVPVSTLEEIEVDIKDLSKATLNQETGEVNWSFALKPKESKTLALKYAIKYPKNRSLVIE